jgi:hypothetical protein
VEAAIGRSGTGWGWQNESQFYGAFIASKGSGRDSLALAVIPADPDSEYTGGDTQVLVRHYELWVLPTTDSGTPPLRYAIGNARLTFVRSGTRWLILKWDDRVDPEVGLDTSSEDLPFAWRRLETIG